MRRRSVLLMATGVLAAGCGFGPAPQARPEASRFGRRRAREEAAIAGVRGLRRAHRPAVDPGRAHADEEAPVEARIMSLEGPVALIGVEVHGAIIARTGGRGSPFSDMAIRRGGAHARVTRAA